MEPQQALLEKLRHYVSDDDVALDNVSFLMMVSDRIRDDLHGIAMQAKDGES